MHLLQSSALLVVSLLCTIAKADEPAPTYQELMSNAGAAFQDEDWSSLTEHLNQAQILRPYSLYILKNRILAHQLAGDVETALALATQAADRGLSLNLSGHPGFDSLKNNPAYVAVEEKFQTNETPIGEAVVSVAYDDATLLPEALAIDSKGNQYLGSVRSGAIISLEHDGKTVAAAPGGIFDLEIRGKKIWAAVNNQLAYVHGESDDTFASIMIFNRKSGAPEREIRVAESDALLGDLEVEKDGTAYVSDSTTPRLYKMAPGGQTLDIFAADPRFVNLQGIALDEKNQRLFVADYLAGLFVVDTKTAEVTAIENAANAHLGGIDGLYFYKGNLIGIQNGTTPQRIVHITLNDGATAATGFIVMQRALPEWNEPTHGVVTKNHFDYIATSNWPSYDKDWNPRDDATLQPVRIITLPLN